MHPYPPPLVFLVGAPGTGVLALHAALQAHCASTPGRTARFLCRESAAVDDSMLQSVAAEPGATTLLMGLDLPVPSADRPAQEAEDARLRAVLAHAGVAFRVVYGQGGQRVAQALSAIKSESFGAYPACAGGPFLDKMEEKADRPLRLRTWHCEKCSDPECEHRLFTSLPGQQPRGA
jgi:hypothetical protein